MSQQASVALIVESESAQVPALTLYDWVQRDYEYRGKLRPRRKPPEPGQMSAGTVFLIGAFAPGAVVGLLQLIRTWLELQRGGAKVYVKVDGTEIGVELAGRLDLERIAGELVDRSLRGAPGEHREA
jgi:hypothetical protein